MTSRGRLGWSPDPTWIRLPGAAGRAARSFFFGFSGNCEVIPQGTYSVGTVVGAAIPFAVVAAVGNISTVLNPQNFIDPVVTVTHTLQASFDDGITWSVFGGATFVGGITLAKDGTPDKRRYGGLRSVIPTHVRITQTVTGGTFQGQSQTGVG